MGRNDYDAPASAHPRVPKECGEVTRGVSHSPRLKPTRAVQLRHGFHEFSRIESGEKASVKIREIRVFFDCGIVALRFIRAPSVADKLFRIIAVSAGGESFPGRRFRTPVPRSFLLFACQQFEEARYASASSVTGCATRSGKPSRLAPLTSWRRQPGLPVATTSQRVARMCFIFRSRS